MLERGHEGQLDALALLVRRLRCRRPVLEAEFLREWAFSGRVYDLEGRRSVRVLPARANGQPAIGTYAWNDEAGAHLPTVLQVLSFEGDRITEITGFVDPTAFGRFGLPERL